MNEKQTRYLRYLKHNPERYWFKRKLYGWGWVPVTWQAWLVVAGFVAWIIFVASRFLVEGRVVEYALSLFGASVATIAIGYWKGEKPRWQWGLPKEDDVTASEKRSVPARPAK